MKTIELVGMCGHDEIRYTLERPLLDMELWQIRVNGDAVASLYHSKDGDWSARCGASGWLTEFEILSFVAIIEGSSIRGNFLNSL